ncbi:hypothetical protein VU07_01180 [Desulfobulbus sp. F4]|nr:hypothetical protein [Desulfobulbus sp. F4]
MKIKNSQNGFVLITALLILLVLTLTGIAVNRNTTTESQIAKNTRLHQEAFYAADAATEMAVDVIRLGISCPAGSKLDRAKNLIIPGAVHRYDIQIVPQDQLVADNEGGAWRKFQITTPSETNRDIIFPYSDGDGNITTIDQAPDQPHANITIAGNVEKKAGAALQMAAGYEGLGKGSGSDTSYLYDIMAQQVGWENTQSIVWVKYRLNSNDTASPEVCAKFQ